MTRYPHNVGQRHADCGDRSLWLLGKYIARRLLDLKHDVITLTNSPQRGNPFGKAVKAFPYNFSKPHELENSLCGVDVLINTYWVRFDKPPYFSFVQAVAMQRFYSRLPSAPASVA